MARRKVASKRITIPDSRYNNVVVAKFISRMMLKGKKSIATRLLYKAIESLKDKTDKSELEVFLKAVDNVKPLVEVKSRRVGGATYQVPVEIRESRREALAMRWIISGARDRSGKNFNEKLAAELLDAYNNTGTAIKKKEDTHKMAEANKAFAHYRW
ncbi:MAG TPA: 30S ribosomal protein S7 [Spirochaetales bacterium]|nr:30S ribosomal protein S7 [Spirochaetales bacterium]HOV38141.1 30S ribosomal protein S7 [Spirochaetales bacterium]